jgi:antitoxin YefM
MPVETSYTQARAHFARLLDRAVEDRETVIITRHGAPSAALIAAEELESLLETAHLLRSPANAARLLKALQRALKRQPKSQSIASLRREMGIERRR